MDIIEYEEYVKFTESFLDTIDFSDYIKRDGKVHDTMERIEDDNFGLYKMFCEKAQAEGRLPAIVEKEDPDFSEIFNVMDEGDFIIYSEKRCGKRMTYEVISVTNYWGSNYKK